jgi:hypothetical protein
MGMATRLILVVCALWFVAVAGLQLLTGNARNDLAMLGIALAPMVAVWVIRLLGSYVLYGRWWIPPIS